MAERERPWLVLGITEEQWEAVKDTPAPPEMTEAQLAEIEEVSRHHLRVIWREVEKPHRRATVFVPIDRANLSPDFLAALSAAKQTVYVRDEALRSLLADLQGEVERLRDEAAAIRGHGRSSEPIAAGRMVAREAIAETLQALIDKHTPKQDGDR